MNRWPRSFAETQQIIPDNFPPQEDLSTMSEDDYLDLTLENVSGCSGVSTRDVKRVFAVLWMACPEDELVEKLTEYCQSEMPKMQEDFKRAEEAMLAQVHGGSDA